MRSSAITKISRKPVAAARGWGCQVATVAERALVANYTAAPFLFVPEQRKGVVESASRTGLGIDSQDSKAASGSAGGASLFSPLGELGEIPEDVSLLDPEELEYVSATLIDDLLEGLVAQNAPGEPGFGVTVVDGQLQITMPGMAGQDKVITLEPHPGENLMLLKGPNDAEPRLFSYDPVEKEWMEKRKDSKKKKTEEGQGEEHRLVEDERAGQQAATPSSSLLSVLVMHFRELGGTSGNKLRGNSSSSEDWGDFKPRGSDLR